MEARAKVGSWGAVLLLALISIGVALQLFFNLRPPYDELHEAANAWRWWQGELLYRDVFEFVGPLPLALNALLFGWLGHPQLEASRLVAGGFAAALLFGAARFTGQLGLPASYGVAVAAGIAFGALPGFRAYFHHWLALAFGMWAMVVAAHAILQGSRASLGWWAAAGGLAGLAMLCTGTRGVVVLVAIAGASLVATWAEGLPWRRGLQQGAALLAGALLAWLPFLAYFAAQGAATQFLLQVWWWPATHYGVRGGANDVWPLTDLDMRFFPMKGSGLSPWAWASALVTGVGTGVLIFLAAPAAAVQGGAVVALAWWKGLRPSRRAQVGLLLAMFLVLEALHTLKGRGDLTHLRYAAPLAFVAWALWAHQLVAQARRLPWGSLRVSMLAPAVSLFLFTALATASDWRTFRGEYREGKVGWGLTAQFRDSSLVAQVRQLLKPGGRVVVYPGCAPVALYSGAKLVGPYTTLARPHWKYHDASDYAAFRQAWRAHPPEVVVISGIQTQETMNDFEGDPSLKGYRFWGRFTGLRGDESSIYWLWAKESLGTPPAGLPQP